MYTLPTTNELGFFGIRLESIGGLGANLAGKMLAEAGVLGVGLNGANFSSYGSEKKGSPVKGYVLFCDTETDIRTHSPIEEPHVIGIFHEALYKTVDVLSGLRPKGIVLINSSRSFDDIKSDLKIQHGSLAIIDALGISLKEKTRINTAMLGALFRICDFLNPEDMRQVIRKTFEKRYPHLVESNIKTFDRGYNEVIIDKIDVPIEKHEKSFSRTQSDLGFKTQEIGGVLRVQGNSLLKDLASSRQGFFPKLEKESCTNCASCDAVCPDFCFVWEEKVNKRGRKKMVLKGIDYQYCKGCLKCIEACPTNALIKKRETLESTELGLVKQTFPMITRRLTENDTI